MNVVRETEEGYWNVELEKASLVITRNRWSMTVWVREKSDGLQEFVLQRQVESYDPMRHNLSTQVFPIVMIQSCSCPHGEAHPRIVGHLVVRI